jgi:hypothetical protein
MTEIQRHARAAAQAALAARGPAPEHVAATVNRALAGGDQRAVRLVGQVAATRTQT